MPITHKLKPPAPAAPAAGAPTAPKKRLRPSGATPHEEERAFAAARKYLLKRGIGPRDLLG